MTVWCSSTWLSTEPRLYFFAPPEVAATSTASEMAMPSEPGLLGSSARMERPAVGQVGWAGKNLRAIGFHQEAPVGFLLVRHLDHIYFQVQVKEFAGHRQRGAPLPGAGFGGHGLCPGGFVIEGLGQGSIRFMAARWRDAFVLVSKYARVCQAPSPGGARGSSGVGRHSLYSSRTSSGIWI